MKGFKDRKRPRGSIGESERDSGFRTSCDGSDGGGSGRAGECGGHGCVGPKESLRVSKNVST